MNPTSCIRRRVQGSGGVELELLDTASDGFPVVFLHGAMERGASWRGALDDLAPSYRCVALDQRGHGRSDKPPSGYDREAYVADLERALDGLGLERCALVGHSTGALNAWGFAARHPERVAALVLEDMHAASRGGDEVEAWRGWLESWPLPFPTMSAVRSYFAALRPSLGEPFCELFAEAADGWRPIFEPTAILETIAGNEVRDWWPELAQVRCPTLLVKGEHSDLSLAEAARMRATLAQGRLVVVEDAWHTVHHDQPEIYRELVADFLAEALGPRRETPAPTFSDARLRALAERQYAHGDAGFAIEPRTTALVLVDLQEEFLTERGGPYRLPGAGAILPAVERLLAGFRARGLPVVHTAFADTHRLLDRPAFGEHMPNRSRETGFDDSQLFREARFVRGVEPRADEIVIHKPSYGAFHDTPLETILRRLGVRHVVLAGVLTDCCVGTTARQAFARGFGVVVASDATATALPAMHDAELRILRRSFARVLGVEEILAALAREPVGAELATVQG